MTPCTETLRTRVDRLEKQSRRDRAVIFSVIVLAILTAQAPVPPAGPQVSTTPITVKNALGQSATLSANGLDVRDPSGTERFFIGVDSEGRPSVDLHDTTGLNRESMYLFDQAPTLRQFDAQGKRRLELRLNPAGNPELQLSDSNEKLRGGFFIGASGRPQIALYGTDEKLRAYLATDDTMPFLVMVDANGTNRISVGGYSDGSVGMDIRNAANTVLWKAP